MFSVNILMYHTGRLSKQKPFIIENNFINTNKKFFYKNTLNSNHPVLKSKYLRTTKM